MPTFRCNKCGIKIAVSVYSDGKPVVQSNPEDWATGYAYCDVCNVHFCSKCVAYSRVCEKCQTRFAKWVDVVNWYLAEDQRRGTRQVVLELPAGGAQATGFGVLMNPVEYIRSQTWCAGYFGTYNRKGTFLLVRADGHVEKLRECPLRIAFAFYRQAAGGLFGIYVAAENSKELAAASPTGYAVFECSLGLDADEFIDMIHGGLSRKEIHMVFAEGSDLNTAKVYDGSGEFVEMPLPSCRFERIFPVPDDCRLALNHEFQELHNYHLALPSSKRDFGHCMEQLRLDWPITAHPILTRGMQIAEDRPSDVEIQAGLEGTTRKPVSVDRSFISNIPVIGAAGKWLRRLTTRPTGESSEAVVTSYRRSQDFQQKKVRQREEGVQVVVRTFSTYPSIRLRYVCFDDDDLCTLVAFDLLKEQERSSIPGDVEIIMIAGEYTDMKRQLQSELKQEVENIADGKRDHRLMHPIQINPSFGIGLGVNIPQRALNYSPYQRSLVILTVDSDKYLLNRLLMASASFDILLCGHGYPIPKVRKVN